MQLLGFEIKAGAQGRLRSLHQYVERSGTRIAIRALENAPEVADVTTPKWLRLPPPQHPPLRYRAARRVLGVGKGDA